MSMIMLYPAEGDERKVLVGRVNMPGTMTPLIGESLSVHMGRGSSGAVRTSVSYVHFCVMDLVYEVVNNYNVEPGYQGHDTTNDYCVIQAYVQPLDECTRQLIERVVAQKRRDLEQALNGEHT